MYGLSTGKATPHKMPPAAARPVPRRNVSEMIWSCETPISGTANLSYEIARIAMPHLVRCTIV